MQRFQLLHTCPRPRNHLGCCQSEGPADLRISRTQLKHNHLPPDITNTACKHLEKRENTPLSLYSRPRIAYIKINYLHKTICSIHHFWTYLELKRTVLYKKHWSRKIVTNRQRHMSIVVLFLKGLKSSHQNKKRQ